MKRREIRRMARYMLRKADDGCELIPVPRPLAAEVHTLIWTWRVGRASERWEQRAAEIPLTAWQAATKTAPEWAHHECPECGIPWDTPSPDCPKVIYNRHPLAATP